MSSPNESVRIETATRSDVAVLLTLIRELAAYEHMSDQVIATETDLTRALFSSRPEAEAVIAWRDNAAVGFALYFQSFSTFVGRCISKTSLSAQFIGGVALVDSYSLTWLNSRSLGDADGLNGRCLLGIN